ncbi:MAG TPA: nucleotidyltransferase family protein [Bacillota bacterium]|nr:nucleotidyltransferase family protein [Bacillota bacterium]
MRVIAVIAEFNPLHFGHAHLLRQIRRSSPQHSKIIVIMPEFFSQRGVPNLISPFQRSKTALAAGADLVLALPELFALSSAEGFAAGAVRSILATGITQEIACGAEDPDYDKLKIISDLLSAESSQYKEDLKAGIKEGLGFAAAREQAIVKETQDLKLASLLSKPNNILAIEYLKALTSYDNEFKIGLTLYPRINTPSASEIRDAIQKAIIPAGCDEAQKKVRSSSLNKYAVGTAEFPSELKLIRNLEGSIPSYSLVPILNSYQEQKGPLLLEHLCQDVFFAISQQDAARISQIAHMQQGLGERLLNLARQQEALDCSLSNFVQIAATRTHPASRVRRALISLLLGLTTADLEKSTGPQYLKVLGFNKDGRYLLRLMSKKADLPIINLASDYDELSSPAAIRQKEISLKAAALWYKEVGGNINQYYLQKPVQY